LAGAGGSPKTQVKHPGRSQAGARREPKMPEKDRREPSTPFEFYNIKINWGREEIILLGGEGSVVVLLGPLTGLARSRRV